MYKVISQCPVCTSKLKVVKLQCDKCGTVIDNDFQLSKFDYLSEAELSFIETFIRCRGNIKEVEKNLGISYPTVRSKLDDVIIKLGCKAVPEPSKEEKISILDALERGELSPEEALEQIQQLK